MTIDHESANKRGIGSEMCKPKTGGKNNVPTQSLTLLNSAKSTKVGTEYCSVSKILNYNMYLYYFQIKIKWTGLLKGNGIVWNMQQGFTEIIVIIFSSTIFK